MFKSTDDFTPAPPAARGFQSRVSEQTPEFWLSFLKTEEALSSPAIQKAARLLAQRPWLVAEPGYAEEKSHFYGWFADTFVPWPRAPSHQGDALADLTVYHEWLHMLTHPRGYPDALDWMAGNRANESQVSIETEILTRARVPGLQERAFPDRDIWVQRLEAGKEALFAERPQDKARMERAMALIEQPSREKALYEKSGGRFLLSDSAEETFWGFTHRELWALRRGVALWPDLSDPVEAQMNHYEAMSDAWLLRWAGPAQEVEAHRLDLQTRSLAGDGEGAIADFSAWLDARRGPHGIPFEHMALEGLAPTPLPPSPSRPQAARRAKP